MLDKITHIPYQIRRFLKSRIKRIQHFPMLGQTEQHQQQKTESEKIKTIMRVIEKTMKIHLKPPIVNMQHNKLTLLYFLL